MSFRMLIQYLRDPSQDLHGFSPYLQRFLQSTPITPIVDISTATIASVLLIWHGLPFWETLRSYSHLLCRRSENARDALHSHDKIARVRLFFSLSWTTVFLAIVRHSADCGAERQFHVNLLSAIPLVTYASRHRPGVGTYEGQKNDFEERLASHNIEKSVVDGMYRWAGNAAIWTHCFVVVYPLRNLLLTLQIHSGRPFFYVQWYLRWYTYASLILRFTLVCAVLVAVAGHSLLSHLRPSPSSALPSRSSVVLLGAISSVAYGCLVRVFLIDRFTWTVWGIGDALLWTASEAWMVYQDSRPADESRAFQRKRTVKRETESEEKCASERLEEEHVARQWLDEVDAMSEDADGLPWRTKIETKGL